MISSDHSVHLMKIIGQSIQCDDVRAGRRDDANIFGDLYKKS